MSTNSQDEWSESLSVREIRRLGRALPKRLKFTRDGKFVVFVTFGLGFAAVNSGNNLLYLIFGMMLSLIMVSGILSEMNLRSIRVQRMEATPLFVGQPMLVKVELFNRKKRFRSLSIEVTELISEHISKGENKQTRGLVMLLEPGERKFCYIRLESTKRGVMPSAGLMVSTKFPFGFFSKRRFFSLPQRYTVLPALENLASNKWETSVAGLDERMAGIGAGDEFHSLRDMRPGEDARMVAWKPSARRDRLMVRENEKPATRRLVITLVNAVQDPAQEFDEFEAAIQRAASLAHHYIGEGYAVGLSTADGGIHPTAERRELKRIFLHLARLPLRRLKAGTTPKLFKSFDSAEHIAVITQGQKDAGLAVAAHREVLIKLEAEATAA